MNIDPKKAARSQLMVASAATIRKLKNFIEHLEQELKCFDEPRIKMAMVALKAVDSFITSPTGLSSCIDGILNAINEAKCESAQPTTESIN